MADEHPNAWRRTIRQRALLAGALLALWTIAIEARLACSTALRSRGFESGSAPVRAATMISFASLVKMRPFVAAASARPLAFH